MPNIDYAAKGWELTRSGGFGNAVRERRKALNLTASELARRTADLGYPISRGAIAKIESNLRSGKVDVAELLVLSAALDIPPVLLLFPEFSTNGSVEVLPGVVTSEDEAVRWVSGRIAFPHGADPEDVEDLPRPPNDGVKLIAAASSLERALEEHSALMRLLHPSQSQENRDTTRGMLQLNRERIAAIKKEIHDAVQALWGANSESEAGESDSNG
jgi:transcriptional regulator with XRE-family HTH domain